MKTYMASTVTSTPRWYVIDAANKTLGRLASVVAARLRGKHKPEYTPHAITGDCIVIINADKVTVTGNKAEDKIYYHHTGYPGGIKDINFNDLQERAPESILIKAVKGMLPSGPLGRDMMRNLKVYAGESHPHQAQQPTLLEEV
jgi:large subunit ribosomal protein L13